VTVASCSAFYICFDFIFLSLKIFSELFWPASRAGQS
jgi:hypothetical protein